MRCTVGAVLCCVVTIVCLLGWIPGWFYFSRLPLCHGCPLCVSFGVVGGGGRPVGAMPHCACIGSVVSLQHSRSWPYLTFTSYVP